LFCYLSLANIAPWQTSLTFAQLLAILRAMRDTFWTVTSLKSRLIAWSV
jgi:hypothetical protein